ncbi:hypothetical protein Baya_0540 [Bagarius yarrelli]|uniref:Uncharacterized protein n=1 Tax=Bagarius yarrelli TaxID=175774 RepID=A0A556TIJ3_BAGYA|nr:hypothetical protein Baya_0540 [Bagarius yarrelli]
MSEEAKEKGNSKSAHRKKKGKKTVNMAGCPSHMLMEENGCVIMIQAIIFESMRARKRQRDGEHRSLERDVENWRIFAGCLSTPWARRQNNEYE